MGTLTSYPGTSQHQALVRAIVSRYENDTRILAVVLFGSLARGNWDSRSDIDCDIFVEDEVHIKPLEELRSLEDTFANVGEKVAFAIPMNDDAADIQFCSLMRLSIRWHPLRLTSPNIVENMRVLAGKLDHASIVEAGKGNREAETTSLSESVDVLVRYAVVANTCIQRNQVWTTLDILHRMRSMLMEVFAHSHGGERGYQFFDNNAPDMLLDKLGATLSTTHLPSLCRSLIALIEILEADLGLASGNQVRLTDAHRVVLDGVRREIRSKLDGAQQLAEADLAGGRKPDDALPAFLSYNDG